MKPRIILGEELNCTFELVELSKMGDDMYMSMKYKIN